MSITDQPHYATTSLLTPPGAGIDAQRTVQGALLGLGHRRLAHMQGAAVCTDESWR